MARRVVPNYRLHLLGVASTHLAIAVAMLALLPAGLSLAALLPLTIGAAALVLLTILVRAASLLTLPVLIFVAIRHAGLLLADAHRNAASKKITDGNP
jgi:hypothetical protein